MQFNQNKFENAVLFFLSKINNPFLGLTKLWKILYFADFDFYELNEKSITGATYKRFPYGPVPSKGEKVLKQMMEAGKIKISIIKTRKGEKYDFISHVEANKSIFSSNELEILDLTAQRFEKSNTAEMSHLSHIDIPYRATEDFGKIDYDLVFYRESATFLDEEDFKVDQEISKSKNVKKLLQQIDAL